MTAMPPCDDPTRDHQTRVALDFLQRMIAFKEAMVAEHGPIDIPTVMHLGRDEHFGYLIDLGRCRSHEAMWRAVHEAIRCTAADEVYLLSEAFTTSVGSGVELATYEHDPDRCDDPRVTESLLFLRVDPEWGMTVFAPYRYENNAVVWLDQTLGSVADGMGGGLLNAIMAGFESRTEAMPLSEITGTLQNHDIDLLVQASR